MFGLGTDYATGTTHSRLAWTMQSGEFDMIFNASGKTALAPIEQFNVCTNQPGAKWPKQGEKEDKSEKKERKAMKKKARKEKKAAKRASKAKKSRHDSSSSDSESS